MSDWKTIFEPLTRGKRYLLMRPIGEGAFSWVVQCKDREKDEVVAVKVLKPDHPHIEWSMEIANPVFMRLQTVAHPNLCRIHDFGWTDQFRYISMDFVSGRGLQVARVQHDLNINGWLTLMTKVLKGLEAIHSAGVIHRNLKPSNILVTDELEPVIIDCGIPPWCGSRPSPKGDVPLFGTPGFLAPEYLATNTIDVRGDFYAYGLILYELLTGTAAFSGNGPDEMIQRQLTHEPIPAGEVKPGLDESLQKILQKCLAPMPADRYTTAARIISDFMVLYWGKKLISELPKKSKVLIVDDEKGIREMFRQMFEVLGLTALTAAGGREGIEKALAELPDLICLDIMMPEMSGLEVAEILLTNPLTTHIPIVLITAKDDLDYMVYCRRLGVRDYVTKPILFADIQQRLPFWLQKKSASKSQE
jgi:serine/threonine protein kinase